VFSEQRGNKIGAITTDGRIVEFEVPTPASAPVGVTAGPAQDVWFAESSAANRIGRIVGFRGLVTAALSSQ
jgi:virginiamycin B lyase